MKAIKDDLDRIMQIMEAAFDPVWGEAWNRRQISDSLVMHNIQYRLVDAAGRPCGESTDAAGFTLVRTAPGEEELLLVAVHPGRRGRGLGRRLLEFCMHDATARGAERVFLEMRANNPAASLYRRAGFETIGRRPDYYRGVDGDLIDAITFARQL